MRLPQIRLESQMAQIGLNQPPAKLAIQQPQAELSIQQPKAEISMQTSPSKLMIDQTQAWEDMNLMGPLRSTDKFAQNGYSGWLEGLGRRAEQGRELMEIENKGNPIANQAQINGHKQMKALGIDFVPSRFAVKISYQPSDVQIDVETNKPIIEAVQNQPIIHYQPGSVDVFMKQYQELKIDFTNLYSETV